MQWSRVLCSKVLVSLNVVNKLLTFMIVMAVAPITSFYAVKHVAVGE